MDAPCSVDAISAGIFESMVSQSLCVCCLIKEATLEIAAAVDVKVGLAVDVGRAYHLVACWTLAAARILKLTHGTTTPRRNYASTHHFTNSYRQQRFTMGNQPSAILDNIASGSNCTCAARKRGCSCERLRG